MLAALALAAAAAAPVSCGRLVVLAADPWWGAVAAGSPAPARAVALAALRAGFLPAFLPVGDRQDAAEVLEADMARRRAAAVLVGPPLAVDAGRLAARHPDVTFVLAGATAGDDGIGNTVQLVFDRSAAFRDAGRLAAGRGPTAILEAPGRPRSETEAFVAGVGDVPGAPQPLVTAVGDAPDMVVLRDAAASLRAAGVSTFLYRPAVSRAAFLDVLAAAGGTAVVEDWEASRPRPQQVLAAVEDDLAAGIRACLARGAPAVVVVPGRLVRGGAGKP